MSRGSDRGNFIVIYGANNLGKSTQAKLLVARLLKLGKHTEYIKYPIYDLEPTGPQINAALRLGEKVSDEELQRFFAQNRRDFEPALNEILDSGINIVAEDYTGTGIAWGMASGLTLAYLEEINKDLLLPDVSILLDGTRFTSGIERGHRHESDYNKWCEARHTHLVLAERYGWEIVNANQYESKVSDQIWDVAKTVISS